MWTFRACSGGEQRSDDGCSSVAKAVFPIVGRVLRYVPGSEVLARNDCSKRRVSSKRPATIWGSHSTPLNWGLAEVKGLEPSPSGKHKSCPLDRSADPCSQGVQLLPAAVR